MREEDEFSREEDPSNERRTGSRTTSVYRPVLIELEDFAGFCLIRNLSSRGMMGQVYAQLAQGEPVTVHINPEIIVTGTIVWSKDQRIGVEFDQEIDVDEVLRELGRTYTGSRLNRAPRLQIQCTAELVVADVTLPAEVQDISQRGVKVAAPLLKPGEEVTVRLEDMAPRKAVVRWSRQGAAGLNFMRPLGFEELARWVIQRHSN